MSDPNNDLINLAHILADWASGVAATLYLYGSRVRGDHGKDSDVDIHIMWEASVDDRSTQWWYRENDDLFRTINMKLPGPIHILPSTDPVRYKIEWAPVVHRDRNVKCVLLAAVRRK